MSSLLKQVIKEMYIDPELLEQLGEEQKQILFRKIRDEQIRRWEVREKELERVPPLKTTPRKIDFLLAPDKNPWVWVMGEHRNDTSYDELVLGRETKKHEDENLAEIMEAETLAKKGISSMIKDFDSVDGAGVKNPTGSESPAGFIRTESQLDVKLTSPQRPKSGRKDLARRNSIIGETQEQRERFEKNRVAEVLGTLRRSKSVAKQRSEKMAKKLEDDWRESQKKADVFERTRKISFRVAREKTAHSPNIHERILDDLPEKRKEEIMQKMSVTKKPARPAPPPPPPSRKKLLKMTSFVQIDSTPRSAAFVVRWFNSIESPKGMGKESDGTISVWFHGKIGRESAMKVLEHEPVGSYLVRLSAKLWGYTVSVKTYEGSRHFLVDASSGQYNFLGPKQLHFKTMTALLEYYKTNPITWDGQEMLLVPVALEDERDVYGGLYSGDSDDEDGSSV